MTFRSFFPLAGRGWRRGKFHYGWARLNVEALKDQNKITATLTGYAYETILNKAIIAGATQGPDDENQPPAEVL